MFNEEIKNPFLELLTIKPPTGNMLVALKQVSFQYQSMMQLKSDAKKFQQNRKPIFKTIDGRDIYDLKRMDKDDEYIHNKYILEYLNFISKLNILSDVLKKAGLCIPYMQRINFYRDCVIEHWSEKIQLNDYPYTVCAYKDGKYPNILLGMNLSKPKDTPNVDRKTLAKELHDNYLNNLDIDTLLNPNKIIENSEKIYKELEKKYPGLKNEYNDEKRSKSKQKNDKKVPKELVELMFKLGFPLPIVDIEDYSESLVNLMKSKYIKN